MPLFNLASKALQIDPRVLRDWSINKPGQGNPFEQALKNAQRTKGDILSGLEALNDQTGTGAWPVKRNWNADDLAQYQRLMPSMVGDLIRKDARMEVLTWPLLYWSIMRPNLGYH